MNIYTSVIDPVDHAVRMVLKEKHVEVTLKLVYPEEEPEELSQINPQGTILTLTDRNLALYDPQIIMEYLDERFPHPPLMSVDPVNRAANRQARVRFMQEIYRKLEGFDEANEITQAAQRKMVREQLSQLSSMFAQKPFLMSDEFSLLDCTVAPLLWRLHHYGVKLPTAVKRNIRGYAERLFERPCFQRSLTDEERELRPPNARTL